MRYYIFTNVINHFKFSASFLRTIEGETIEYGDYVHPWDVDLAYAEVPREDDLPDVKDASQLPDRICGGLGDLFSPNAYDLLKQLNIPESIEFLPTQIRNRSTIIP